MIVTITLFIALQLTMIRLCASRITAFHEAMKTLAIVAAPLATVGYAFFTLDLSALKWWNSHNPADDTCTATMAVLLFPAVMNVVYSDADPISLVVLLFTATWVQHEVWMVCVKFHNPTKYKRAEKKGQLVPFCCLSCLDQWKDCAVSLPVMLLYFVVGKMYF